MLSKGTLTSWTLPKQASFMAPLFRKNVDPKKGNEDTLLPPVLEVVPLPKPLCGLEMQLSKKNVTQWPHWCPTGQCLGSINTSSAHVTPTSWGLTSPHEGPLPPKPVHLKLRITSPRTPRDPALGKGDPRDSHRNFPRHSQSPSPTGQSLQPSHSHQALPSPLLATL